MLRNGVNGKACLAGVTLADIQEELHRLHESQMILLLMAEKIGIAVPRSCCLHPGDDACASCSANWIAAEVRARYKRSP